MRKKARQKLRRGGKKKQFRNLGLEGQQEGGDVQDPGERETPRRRLGSEDRPPADSRGKEDGTNDVEVEVRLRGSTGEQDELECGCREELTRRHDNRVKGPLAYLSAHEDPIEEGQ